MISIEWPTDEEAYIVKQNEEFIGDFTELIDACRYALEVRIASSDIYTEIHLLSVKPR